jgi:hypothetical protein
MPMKLWYFVRSEDGTFVDVPRARFQRFMDGVESLATFVTTGNEVLAAEVIGVLLAEEFELRSLAYRRFETDKSGCWSIPHKERATRAFLDDALESLSEERNAKAKPIAPPRHVKSRITGQHSWQPMPADRQECRQAIELKAMVPVRGWPSR